MDKSSRSTNVSSATLARCGVIMSSRTLLLFIVLCVEIRFFHSCTSFSSQSKKSYLKMLIQLPQNQIFLFLSEVGCTFSNTQNMDYHSFFTTSFYYNCCTLISYVYKKYLIYISSHDIVKALHFASQTQTVLQC